MTHTSDPSGENADVISSSSGPLATPTLESDRGLSGRKPAEIVKLIFPTTTPDATLASRFGIVRFTQLPVYTNRAKATVLSLGPLCYHLLVNPLIARIPKLYSKRCGYPAMQIAT